MGKSVIKLFYYRHSFEKNEKWKDKKKRNCLKKKRPITGYATFAGAFTFLNKYFLRRWCFLYFTIQKILDINIKYQLRARWRTRSPPFV